MNNKTPLFGHQHYSTLPSLHFGRQARLTHRIIYAELVEVNLLPSYLTSQLHYISFEAAHKLGHIMSAQNARHTSLSILLAEVNRIAKLQHSSSMSKDS